MTTMIIPTTDRGWTPEPEKWMLIVLAVTLLTLIFASSTARAAEPNVWKTPPKADSKVQCVHGEIIVPCEIVPSSALDAIEARNRWLQASLDAEVKNHNTTLDMLQTAETRAIAAETLRDEYRAERDLARDQLRGNLPTWARVTVVVVALATGVGFGVWVAK